MKKKYKFYFFILLYPLQLHLMEPKKFNSALNYIDQEININDHKRIIDIGCGNGHITAAIAQQAPDSTIIGIDKSKKLITKAQDKQIRSSGFLNLSFFCENVEKFDFEWPFNLAVSFNTLHLLENQQVALNKIYNSLKSNGILHLTMNGKNNSYHITQAWKDTIGSLGWIAFFDHKKNHTQNLLTEKELEKMLKKASFNHIEIQEITRTKKFKSKKQLIIYIKSLINKNKTSKNFYPLTKEKLAIDIANNFTKKNQNQQPITLQNTTLIAYAVK